MAEFVVESRCSSIFNELGTALAKFLFPYGSLGMSRFSSATRTSQTSKYCRKLPKRRHHQHKVDQPQQHQPLLRYVRTEPIDPVFERLAGSKFKIFLFGTLGAGKTTVYKQAKYHFGLDWVNNVDERMSYLLDISHPLVEEMTVLIQAVGGVDAFESPETRAAVQHMLGQDYSQMVWVDPKLAHSTQVLWNDAQIQLQYRNRSRNPPVHDNLKYTCQEISRMSQQGQYMPTFKDILMLPRMTTGTNEWSDSKTEVSFRDHGGSRSDRWKWGATLKMGCSGIIFVAALSEYDEVLFEDWNANRLVESIAVFDQLVNNPELFGIPFVLFLNKLDVFTEKLVDYGVPLDSVFPDYPATTQDCCDVSDAVTFIMHKYLDKCRDPSRMIPVIVGNATDTDKVKEVLVTLFNCLKPELPPPALIEESRSNQKKKKTKNFGERPRKMKKMLIQ